jgi:hypothetical protein
MARDDAPSFQRGETWYNGSPIDATDNTTLGGVNIEGREFVFEDNAPTQYGVGVPPQGTGRKVRCKCVRNLSGINLKPGRAVKYATTDPYETRIIGYTFAVGDRPAGIVDEFLPSAGVVPNDLFWIVREGPTKVTQPHTANSALVIGSVVVPTAGGGASATDDLSGRVLAQDLTGATATLGGNIQNRIGYISTANNVVDALVPCVVHLAGG